MIQVERKIKEDFIRTMNDIFAMDIEDSTPYEQYQTLGYLIRTYMSEAWKNTNKEYLREEKKQIYYFSIEFLPGRMLKSNLLNLGILPNVRKAMKELGLDMEKIIEMEEDSALGNGGLGRLASCFLDSMSSTEIAGHGNGIRYRQGLFKQRFIDGHQVELPDNWLQSGNVWEVRKENKAVEVKFGGKVSLIQGRFNKLEARYEGTSNILAVPYDVPMLGYKNDTVNTLRLWSAEIPEHEDRDFDTQEERRAVERITEALYPDDSDFQGKRLRLEQEYFFVSAGIQSILAYYDRGTYPIERLAEKVAIHINDTHPAMAIPEMMRMLMDDYKLTWEAAWDITVKVMSYTNHTLLEEALEKWPVTMVQEVVPRIYQIIQEIDRRFAATHLPIYGTEIVNHTRVISNGYIHMAHLAVIGSHSVNGVAKLHSNLLKENVLHDLYTIYPMRFSNKTNGVTHRRWLEIANEPLVALLDETIGEEWKRYPNNLKLLLNFKEDEKVLEKIRDVKYKNKVAFAKYVKNEMGIEINPHAIFDVHIKRLHAYKRQLLNLLEIISTYLELKDNPTMDFYPKVYIFGAKAAPSYLYAKEIIKVINSVADLINNDGEIDNKMKIIFVENYGVSIAEKIIPAADISEQISLASKEASGTGNMKLMLNGAITLATLDGANVEIKECVGDDNIFIFGLESEEVYAYYRTNHYNPTDIYQNNPTIHRTLNALVDGTIPNIEIEGRSIFDSLTKNHDEYFVLKDFDEYKQARTKAMTTYLDEKKWNQMVLVNIAEAGRFSSDYTVEKYAEDIWDIPHKSLF